MNNQINSFLFSAITVLILVMHSFSATGKSAETPKKPNQHFLDEQSKFKDVPVPDSLVNTLNDKDYYNAHY